MTRQELLEQLDEASDVYVIVEISKGNPINVLIDPDNLRDVIEAEGKILGNNLVAYVNEDEDGTFDLYVGVS